MALVVSIVGCASAKVAADTSVRWEAGLAGTFDSEAVSAGTSDLAAALVGTSDQGAVLVDTFDLEVVLAVVAVAHTALDTATGPSHLSTHHRAHDDGGGGGSSWIAGRVGRQVGRGGEWWI